MKLEVLMTSRDKICGRHRTASVDWQRGKTGVPAPSYIYIYIYTEHIIVMKKKKNTSATPPQSLGKVDGITVPSTRGAELDFLRNMYEPHSIYHIR